MSNSNTQIQVSNLDFSGIKQNFINYLQSQDTFKDFNFSGSAISTLLDVLAYNTQYNAFYLNMTANEMFLDSAIQRSSVVSHAKLMNYVPNSAIGPIAVIGLTFNGVTGTYFTIPKYTNFLSESVNGVNYNYVAMDNYSASVANSQVSFSGVELKQGSLAEYTFAVNSTTNPSYLFEIPDSQIDTTTLAITVRQSNSNTAYQIYNSASNYLQLGPTDLVYFMQEGISGNYQIYFGDGVLGNKLSDGNLIDVKYVSTSGTSGGGANNFTLMDNLGSFTSYTINPQIPATTGQDIETIDSIKFQAPKSFAAQGRAVSKNDYITAIQKNSLGIQFDAVSVWGGEDNTPPVYGQVFICLKPKGAYDLTESQKTRLVSEVIKPISVMTVEPVIVDPDYTYLTISANVLFQQSQTTLTPAGIQSAVQTALYAYSSTNLNTFNSTLNSFDVLNTINTADQSILASDYTLNLQKKFYPNLNTPTTYVLYYNGALQKGMFQSGISSSPALKFRDPSNPTNTIDNVFLEEVPNSTAGVDSINILNPGFSYSLVPTITITGDGVGATAVATVTNSSISAITITNPGVGYTSAIVTVTPASGDTTGKGAALICILQGQFGILRSYYNSNLNAKTILNANVGTIDYINGTVTLNNFNPLQIDNALGQLTVTVKPTTTIISSTFDRIITVDPFDPSAISVQVNAKKN
jgi:hypothetical protein